MFKVKTQETIESIEEQKRYEIEAFRNNTEFSISLLSSELFEFSKDLQNLYDSIINHTKPGGDLTDAKTYLEHIKQIGIKLEECQLLGDELENCRSSL